MSRRAWLRAPRAGGEATSGYLDLRRSLGHPRMPAGAFHAFAGGHLWLGTRASGALTSNSNVARSVPPAAAWTTIAIIRSSKPYSGRCEILASRSKLSSSYASSYGTRHTATKGDTGRQQKGGAARLQARTRLPATVGDAQRHAADGEQLNGVQVVARSNRAGPTSKAPFLNGKGALLWQI